MLENSPQVCHGRGASGDSPVYIQEVVLLRALRALREWLSTIDQRLVQDNTIWAGNGSLRHTIKQWLNTGACILESPAASGIVTELQSKEEWSTIDTAMWP